MLQLPPRYQNDEFVIINEKWNSEDSLVIQKISVWEVQILRLQDNHRASLVKQIAHIHFVKLRQLKIWENEIQQLEDLVSIDMKNLKKIYLPFNRIISIRLIRKAQWPHLQCLSISCNPFGDGYFLTQGHFPSLTKAFLDYPNKYKNNKLADLCFPSKLQTSSLDQIQIMTYKFCGDRSVEGVLNKKWKKAYIS